MNFGFLAPLFLTGLAALAIPVWMHLVHRHDAVVQRFPSLMFLQRATQPLQRRRQLRHPLLLALRCLGIALLIFGFAQPYLESSHAVTEAESILG